MKCSLISFTLSLALAAPVADAKTLTISFDKSGSNPLLDDPHFAASAAEYVAGRVKTLKEGDVVRIRSFGARNEGANLLDQTFVLNRRLRARSWRNPSKTTSPICPTTVMNRKPRPTSSPFWSLMAVLTAQTGARSCY